ncbi:hypothetical protein CYQ88_01585 [Hydrogenovibrio sp. SC-1]|uniref:hypothetical protein n=1 Tax=Hydrogenovibrio sp. SC-1 TaxID=2065820 RepID=UPI000C7B4C6D|nr:hypothetical protein [Hydrogenovibrio sp. SC-1]PLA75285.1 hypothetical protein CYQ88_01585 [Hydrogenovibrio sp. SC-1]
MENKRIYRHGHGFDEQHKKNQALFSKLMEHHHEIFRETELLEMGIRPKTTSPNPHIASILQEHVSGMEKRFAMGRAIRSWDPLFAALFEYRDNILLEYYSIQNGVEAKLTTNDPKILEILHCHNETIHGFIQEGANAGKRQSPKPEWLE